MTTLNIMTRCSPQSPPYSWDSLFLVFFFLLCKSLVLVSFNYVKNIRYIVLYVCFGADLMFYVCFEAMTPLPFLGAGGVGGWVGYGQR